MEILCYGTCGQCVILNTQSAANAVTTSVNSTWQMLVSVLEHAVTPCDLSSWFRKVLLCISSTFLKWDPTHKSFGLSARSGGKTMTF